MVIELRGLARDGRNGREFGITRRAQAVICIEEQVQASTNSQARETQGSQHRQARGIATRTST